ncbi:MULTISPECIES: MarR family winged helix-turn-helix transcriptional regulator [Ferrimonas]|uniref:MarR family winged helix-turn-helix transcriptional regulator n=1 Tax=Ferrimonas TaxID=44011 RepID=UPI0004298E29|nr:MULTISPECIES: MarR family transcriptional regulator [Ferrimonas]USD39264.1 MarR family transcriptional regulator [Ferrimonas sp. SCSIO 43195]
MNQNAISDTLFDLIHAYKKAMRSELKAKQLGLNAMHVKCLTYIANQDTCTAVDMVGHLGRDKAQIARLIKEMVEKQWLTKTAHPQDKRSQLLTLTEQGQQLAALIQHTRAKVQKRMGHNLTEAQLATFDAIAATITANLSTDNHQD